MLRIGASGQGKKEASETDTDGRTVFQNRAIPETGTYKQKGPAVCSAVQDRRRRSAVVRCGLQLAEKDAEKII